MWKKVSCLCTFRFCKPSSRTNRKPLEREGLSFSMKKVSCLCYSFLLFPFLLLLCLCCSIVFSYSFVSRSSTTLSYSCAYNAQLLSLVSHVAILCITLLHLGTLHSLVHYTPSLRYFTFILCCSHALHYSRCCPCSWLCVCLILSPCILLLVKECGVIVGVELLCMWSYCDLLW